MCVKPRFQGIFWRGTPWVREEKSEPTTSEQVQTKRSAREGRSVAVAKSPRAPQASAVELASRQSD